jgi:hypothetical protein
MLPIFEQPSNHNRDSCNHAIGKASRLAGGGVTHNVWCHTYCIAQGLTFKNLQNAMVSAGP